MTEQPVVTKLSPSLGCAWCRAAATYEVDGTSTCSAHYPTAYRWAEQKRAGR